MEEDKDPAWCPVCALNDRSSRLQTFHINFEESIVMCPEPVCTYPIGVESLTKVLTTPDNLTSSLHSLVLQPVQMKPCTQETQTSENPDLNIFDWSTKLSYSPSNVSTTTSINSPLLSVLNIQTSPLSQNLPNSSVLDSTFAVEQNLNFDDSLPAIDTDFLNEIFDPVPESGDGQVGKSEVAQNPELLTKFPVEPSVETDLNCTLEKLNSDDNVKMDVGTISVVTSASTVSLESAKTTVTSTSQTFSSPASVSVFPPATPAPAQETQVLALTNDVIISADSAATVVQNPGNPVVSQMLYPQWKNKDSFCWLDVSMNLLTHCEYLLKLASSLSTDSLLVALINTYKRALDLTNDKRGKGIRLETSLGHVVVKTGGGQSPGKFSLSTITEGLQPLVCAVPEAKDQNEVDALLNDVRELLWRYLQPRMRIERGNHDSPVFALPLLLNHKEVREEFLVSYTWQMVCCHCRHHHEDKVEKVMPTFPNVPSDFSMLAPCFIRSCFKCNAKKQRINMVFDRLPPVVFVHFVEGISVTSFEELDFQYRGSNYRVTGVVQYTLDHFVCWLRHHKEELWRKCDDLEGGNTAFCAEKPQFPTKEVHVVMWEVIGECVHLKNAEPKVQSKARVLPSTKSPAAYGSAKNPVEIVSRGPVVVAPVKKSNVPQRGNTAIVLPSLSTTSPSTTSPSTTSPSTPQVVQQVAAPVSGVVMNNIPQRAAPVSGYNIGNTVPNNHNNRKPEVVMNRVTSPAVSPVNTSQSVVKTSTNAQPKKNASSKKKASDDRLQKIRERLEQLKAANAKRAGSKQGGNPLASPGLMPQTHPAYLSTPLSTPTAKPAEVSPSTSASSTRGKSYLAALQPFLQRKVEKTVTSNKTKQFTGYMTKAERSVAAEAKRRQDEQIALLLGATKKPDPKREPRTKSVSQVMKSPKKSVRFTGDPAPDSEQFRAKRSLEDPLASLSKFSKKEHGASKVLKSSKQHTDSVAKQSFRDKLCNLKINPVKSQLEVGIGLGNPGGNSGSEHYVTTAEGAAHKSELNVLQTPGGVPEDPSKIAKEDSVINELLELVFNDPSPNMNNLNSAIPANPHASDTLVTPDLNDSSLDGFLNTEDTNMFSMPMFF